MRKTYHAILKQYFRVHLMQNRMALKLTQLEMSVKLSLDERSYSDLERGKTCCSAVTLALYLVYVCEDKERFLEELRYAFENGKESVA